MRSASLALVALGIAPLLLLGLASAGSLAREVVDPCMDWGEQWGPFQAGGGTSAPTPGCEQGSSWTTGSRANAVVRLAWLPVGGIAAAILGYVGIARRNAWAAALAIAVLLAVGFPLTLGMTLFLAALPALFVAIAARLEGLAPTPPSVGVGLVAGAFVLLLVGIAVRTPESSPALMWGFAVVYPAQLAAVALACLVPRAGTAKWRRQDARA